MLLLLLKVLLLLHLLHLLHLLQLLQLHLLLLFLLHFLIGSHSGGHRGRAHRFDSLQKAPIIVQERLQLVWSITKCGVIFTIGGVRLFSVSYHDVRLGRYGCLQGALLSPPATLHFFRFVDPSIIHVIIINLRCGRARR